MISNFETFEQRFNLLYFKMFQFNRSVVFAFAHMLIVGFVGMIVALIAEGKALLLFYLIESIFESGFRAKPPKEPPKEPPNKMKCWTRVIVTSVGASYLMGSTQIDSALENQVRAQNFETDCWLDRGSFASSHSVGCDLIHSFTKLYSCMDSTLEPYGSSFHLNCGFDHENIADSSFRELPMHSSVRIPARPRPFEVGKLPEPSRHNDRVRFDTWSAFEINDYFIARSSCDTDTIQYTFAAGETKVFDTIQFKADWFSSWIFEIANEIALHSPDLIVPVFEIAKLRLLVLIASHREFEEPGRKQNLIVALFEHFNWMNLDRYPFGIKNFDTPKMLMHRIQHIRIHSYLIVALNLVSDVYKTADRLMMILIDDAAAFFVVEHDDKAQFFSCEDSQDRTSFCEGDLSDSHRSIIIKSLEDILVDDDDVKNKMHSAQKWSTARRFRQTTIAVASFFVAMAASFAEAEAAKTKANAAKTRGTVSALHRCFGSNIILAAMLLFAVRATFSPLSKNASWQSQVACILAMMDSLAKICVSSGKRYRFPPILLSHTIAEQLLQYFKDKSIFVSRGSVRICIAYFSRYVSQSVILRLQNHFIYVSYSCFGLRGSVRIYKSYISAIPIFNMEIASLQTFSELLK